MNIVHFEEFGDDRGSLISIESNKNIPFKIKRVYYIFGTKENVKRGCHAHKKLEQILICIQGRCKVFLYDGYDKKEFLLNKKTMGLYVKSMIWREMFDFSEDALLLVLANDYYNEQEYIRNTTEFENLIKKDIRRTDIKEKCSD